MPTTSSTTTPPRPPTLQIRQDGDAKGRRLHAAVGPGAARITAAGQALHVFAQPALVQVATPLLARLCSHCLRGPGAGVASSPRACSRCRAAFYCDAACQRAAWAAGHGRECGALSRRRVADRPAAALPTPVRALVRALLCPRAERAWLAALRGHDPPAAQDGARDLQLMALAACAMAGRDVADPAAVREAAELLCKIQTNTFHRYDPDLGQVAIFLEPTLAMANHSCIPNALVHFVGLTAVLTAERPIKAGDEIEISYTDYTYPLTKRREALAAYCFECRCARCRGDLNVYQVCAAFPADVLPPGLSLVLNLSDQLNGHPAVHDAATQALARSQSESATRATEARASREHPPGHRRHFLLAQLRDCRELLQARLWAVTPVPQVLTEVSIFLAESHDFASALAVACLVASKCDPFRYTTYCHPVRAKNVLVIAKLLANTAQETPALSQAVRHVPARSAAHHRVREALQNIDQVSLCQMLLNMVLRSAPVGHEVEWDLAAGTRDMLRDIEQLPGREKELSLITAWMEDPAAERSRAFFDYAVVQQVDALARLGPAVLVEHFHAET